MTWDPQYRPQLRPVEPFAAPREDTHGDNPMIGLRDPSGLSDVVLTVSQPALQLLALMDGEHSCAEIRDEFLTTYGQPVSTDTVEKLLSHLEEAHLLDCPGFEKFYEEKLTAYRERGIREMPHAHVLGLAGDPGHYLDGILARYESVSLDGKVVGIVAPHLDYPRGEPCYAAAYGTLRSRPTPDRVIVLGTNHFGRSTSVVATGNDFRTPLGTTRADGAFLAKLQAACGDLRRFELDHEREHSVELQLAFLQQLFGAAAFTLVPVLCNDPCGQQEGDASETNGVDIRDFAIALRDLIRDDPQDTLVVAGADLSHVGENFGDDPHLADSFLKQVEDRDRSALRRLVEGTPDSFVQAVGTDENPTRVCSAGCLYVIATVLSDAAPTMLRYHQTVDQETQTCVSCAAVAYTNAS